jgi:UDP-N-acetylmuramoylalanine--D-glutamate ligase
MTYDVLVLGGGESGTWAAILSKLKGFDTLLIDQQSLKPHFKNLLEEHNIPFFENLSDVDHIETKLVVVSPGIPDHHPWMKYFKTSGIDIISELEFASRYNDKPILAITGSNGKTTTSKLAYHILSSCGIQAALGGNYGLCFSNLLINQASSELYVLEVSSFQLDHIQNFKPNVAIILNITPDHLDRYEYKFELYASSKFRIAKNQDHHDHLILHSDLREWKQELDKLHTTIQFIDLPPSGQRIIQTDTGILFDVQDDRLLGKHNIFNATCAIEAALHFTNQFNDIQLALHNFESDPHRLEIVDYIDGVRYINDSKATNVDAVYYALEAMDQPVVWILGGQDKGNDYSVLDHLVKNKVKALICLGLNNQKIIDYYQEFNIPIEETKSAKETVNKANKYANKNETVLLSPACASFDLFDNYMDRGQQYKNAIYLLRKS